MYNAVNAIRCTDFSVWIDVDGTGTHAPPATRIARETQLWLESLDADEVIHQQDHSGRITFPEHIIEASDWRFRIQAIPLKEEARGRSTGQSLGAIGGQVHWCRQHQLLRRAVKKKAEKYRNIDLPFIVAVNSLDVAADREELAAALLGDYGVRFSKHDGTSTPFRKPNGAWRGPSGPVNKNISGVLYANCIMAHTIAKVQPELWHNPWCRLPLESEEQWHIDEYRQNTETNLMVCKEGMPSGSILQIDSNILRE